MARIVHIAIKVENLEDATQFYEEVYGFKQVETERNGQHISRHMTDGYIDLALMVYDSEDAPEAQLSGKGPCIHHIGIEVDDRKSYEEKIKAFGGTILSKPGAGALKYRSPDGTIAEIVAAGRYEEKKERATRGPILSEILARRLRHVRIMSTLPPKADMCSATRHVRFGSLADIGV